MALAPIADRLTRRLIPLQLMLIFHKRSFRSASIFLYLERCAFTFISAFKDESAVLPLAYYLPMVSLILKSDCLISKTGILNILESLVLNAFLVCLSNFDSGNVYLSFYGHPSPSVSVFTYNNFFRSKAAFYAPSVSWTRLFFSLHFLLQATVSRFSLYHRFI